VHHQLVEADEDYYRSRMETDGPSQSSGKKVKKIGVQIKIEKALNFSKCSG